MVQPDALHYINDNSFVKKQHKRNSCLAEYSSFVSQNWEIKWSWFPGPGGAYAKEGVPTYYLANFFPQNCMKIKENWAKSKRGAFPAFCQIWRRMATCELGRLETVLLYFLFLLVNHWMVPRYNLQRWTTSQNTLLSVIMVIMSDEN